MAGKGWNWMPAGQKLMELFWNIWMVRHWKPVWTACLNRANWKNWKNFCLPILIRYAASMRVKCFSRHRSSPGYLVMFHWKKIIVAVVFPISIWFRQIFCFRIVAYRWSIMNGHSDSRFLAILFFIEWFIIIWKVMANVQYCVSLISIKRQDFQRKNWKSMQKWNVISRNIWKAVMCRFVLCMMRFHPEK